MTIFCMCAASSERAAVQPQVEEISEDRYNCFMSSEQTDEDGGIHEFTYQTEITV